MQTSIPEKYPFFRNHNHKKRIKTLQSYPPQQKPPNILKQSTPVMIRRRNLLKQTNDQKSIKIIDFKPMKHTNTLNNQHEAQTYKNYTEQYAIPKFTTEANAESIDQVIYPYKDKIKTQEAEFRISQANNFQSIRRHSLSNNKSYDQSKRSAIFTRKSLYSINSIQKNKKNPTPTPVYYYPSDRYKSLNSKQIILESKKQSPYYNPMRQRQKDRQRQRQQLSSKKNSFSISRNRYLLIKQDPPQRIQSQQNNNGAIKKIRHHSTSHTQIIDNNFQKLIKKQFSSVSVKQLNNEPVIRNHLDPMYLTEFQREQIKNYRDVYYIGHKAYLRKYKEQGGFRDQKNNYKPIIGDHIAYRFQIVRVLGSGAFGKVLQVVDHKDIKQTGKKKNYALKILKKSEDLYEQFKLQIKILKIAKQNTEAIKNIVQIKGDFQFRNHICVVTELLDLNVYAFIKNQQFEGLSLEITRKIMIQVLQALLFLHHQQIVHCDIKPQNIVFKQEGKSGVKLIDFGSACFVDKKQFTYIQSRYYRSPQIVLVKPYDEKIDVWSTGCLAYEIFTGSPLFPARCEQEQLQMLKQTLGAPPQHFLDKCQRAQQFQFQQIAPVFPLKKRIQAEKTGSAFLDFLQKMIRWSPQQRMSIKQALMHEFILEGLPQKVKKQHINQMKSQNPYGLFRQW